MTRMPWRLPRGRDRPRLFRRLPPSRDRASSERVTSGDGGEDAPRDHGEGREAVCVGGGVEEGREADP